MQESVLYIVLVLLFIVIYLLINKRKDKGQDKLVEETNRLREEVNKSTML